MLGKSSLSYFNESALKSPIIFADLSTSPLNSVKFCCNMHNSWLFLCPWWTTRGFFFFQLVTFFLSLLTVPWILFFPDVNTVTLVFHRGGVCLVCVFPRLYFQPFWSTLTSLSSKQNYSWIFKNPNWPSPSFKRWAQSVVNTPPLLFCVFYLPPSPCACPQSLFLSSLGSTSFFAPFCFRSVVFVFSGLTYRRKCTPMISVQSSDNYSCLWTSLISDCQNYVSRDSIHLMRQSGRRMGSRCFDKAIR